jgi:4-amino-4-deoxy-L-arabinose transferase-like glycosyltransferase
MPAQVIRDGRTNDGKRPAVEVRIDLSALSPATRRVLALVPILLLGLGLRLAYLTGCVGSDDLAYSTAAHRLITGDYFGHLSVGMPLTYTRLAIVGPLAGIYAIFGISEPTSILYPLLCSLSGIVLVFLVASRIFSPRTGVFAAFLLAIAPLDIYYSTIMLPDIVQAAFATLAIYLFIAARKQQGSKATASLLMTGASLGVCISIKENGWLLAAALALGIIVEAIGHRWRWQLLLVILGAIVSAGAENAVLWAGTGDPMFRYKVTAASAAIYENQTIPTVYGAAAAVSLISKVTSKFLYVFTTRETVGLAGFLFAIAPVWYAFQRRFNWRALVVAWLLLMVAGAAYVDVRHFSYQPRRLLPALHPSLILVAALVCESALARCARLQLVAATIAVALIIAPLFMHRESYNRGLASDLRAAYSVLDASGRDRPVFADPRSAPILALYGGFRPERTVAALPADVEGTKNAYVVLCWRWIAFYERGGHVMPDYIRAIPNWWKPVASFSNPETGLSTDVYAAGDPDTSPR